MSDSSSHSTTAGGTGTSVAPSAEVTRYSRATSWAEGVRPARGGVRITQADDPSSSRKVRLDRPPAISRAVSGPARSTPAPAICAATADSSSAASSTEAPLTRPAPR